MGILDGLIDDVTNTLGDFVDVTSSERSLTPGFDINTPDSGYFTGVEDAMSSLGGEFRSPAFASVDRMKDASTSLNVTDNLDLYTLQQGFGADNANQMWDTLQEVQGLSDSLDECGNYAQDALSAATTDYIKNTGIQEAGRDLADKIDGIGGDGVTDCVAGFATLFDSAGVIDDALGLGDLPQIQSRIGDVIRDATDPSKLSNMLLNLDVVSGLLDDFNDMCTGMKDAFNKLIQSDLSAINASLNKLAQWAAFAKIATSDPCALVNNNKMLSHITEPVMDDIVKIYNKVTGSDNFGPDNPIIPLGEILGTKPKFPDIPRYNQAVGEGLLSFEYYKSNIPGEFITVTHSIEKGNPLVFVNGEWVESVAGSNEPLSFVGGEWVENAAFDAKSSFTQGLTKGITSIDDSTQNFVSSASAVALSVLSASGKTVENVKYTLEDGTVVSKYKENVTKAKQVTRSEAAALTSLKADKGSGADKTKHLPNIVTKEKDKFTTIPSNTTFSTTSTVTNVKEVKTEPKIVDDQWKTYYNDKLQQQPWPANFLALAKEAEVCGCVKPSMDITDFAKLTKDRMDSAAKSIDRIGIEMQDLAKKIQASIGYFSVDTSKYYETGDQNNTYVQQYGKLDLSTPTSIYYEQKVIYDNIQGKAMYPDGASCSGGGGDWKCESVKVLPQAGMAIGKIGCCLPQSKNFGLNTTLPSKGAFDTSKIGL